MFEKYFMCLDHDKFESFMHVSIVDTICDRTTSGIYMYTSTGRNEESAN